MRLDGTIIEMEILNQQKVIDSLVKIGYTNRLMENRLGMLESDINNCLTWLWYRFKLEIPINQFIELLENNKIMVFKTSDEYNSFKIDLTSRIRDNQICEQLKESYEAYRASKSKAA